MKITTFNPQIITKDAASLEKFFGELGFETRHDQKGIGEHNVEAIRMKDGNGFYLDISAPEFQFEKDILGIRMNVDDFGEAYKLLTEHGFRNVYGNNTADTKTSKSAVMVAPSGYVINLVQHIKN